MGEAEAWLLPVGLPHNPLLSSSRPKHLLQGEPPRGSSYPSCLASEPISPGPSPAQASALTRANNTTASAALALQVSRAAQPSPQNRPQVCSHSHSSHIPTSGAARCPLHHRSNLPSFRPVTKPARWASGWPPSTPSSWPGLGPALACLGHHTPACTSLPPLCPPKAAGRAPFLSSK